MKWVLSLCGKTRRRQRRAGVKQERRAAKIRRRNIAWAKELPPRQVISGGRGKPAHRLTSGGGTAIIKAKLAKGPDI